jgi:predicted esterase
MTLIAQGYSGILSAGEAHIELYPKVKPSVLKPGVLNLHGASGDAWTVIGWLNDSKPGTPNYVARNGQTGISADAGGPQTWGNQAAIDGAQRSYTRLQIMRGVKPGKVFLIGASMGGLTALNWAAANPDKIAGIVLIIPVINLNDIKVNNRGGYASLVNAAYGGNYDQATQGATKNPQTMAAAGKYSGIPILLYYGLTDTTCVPAEATTFASTVGSNVETVALNSGHDNNSYHAVDNQRIIDFFNAHL